MAHSQPGIFAMGNPAHIFLEFSLESDLKSKDAITALVDTEQLFDSVYGVNTVIGIRPSIWNSLSSSDNVPHINDFSDSIVGVDGFTMPATQRDIWVWIAGQSTGQVFDCATVLIQHIKEFVEIEEELYGWTYQFNRDLTGFIDGSANPNLLEAAEIALIPRDTPGENGSILLFQKWQHNADKFGGLSLYEQESVIGRTKLDSEEFDEDKLPANSHVAKTTIEKDGEELKIFRRNVSHGSPSNHGTIFIGFSHEQDRLHEMLNRMCGIPDGVRDALTNFTTPLTGSYYFIPSEESLTGFAKQNT